MNNIVIKAARTEDGYCCACDLLPGWVVAYDGDLDGFKMFVQESVDFWLEGRRKDGDDYPHVFDGDYQLVYDFDVATLLDYYRGIFSFAALQEITGINQSNSHTMRVASPNHANSRLIKSSRDCADLPKILNWSLFNIFNNAARPCGTIPRCVTHRGLF